MTSKISLAVLLTAAFMLLVAGCGSDGDKEGARTSGLACITRGDDGATVHCTEYSGSIFKNTPGFLDLACPSSSIIQMEHARSCPRGDRYGGHCQHSPGAEDEMHIYYYIDDGDMEIFQTACESQDGIWHHKQ